MSDTRQSLSDLAKLTGEEIAKILADMPYSGNAEILAAIRGNNPNLGNEGHDVVSSRADAAAVWDHALAKLNPKAAAAR